MRSAANPVAIAIAILVAGCGATGPARSAPDATWPVGPETLAIAPETDTSKAQLDCNDFRFPRSGLTAPVGAETAAGPEYDALRETLRTFGGEFPGAATAHWQVAGRTDFRVLFLARQPPAGDGIDWMAADITRSGAAWKPSGMGGCRPVVVLADGLGPAEWVLDPDAGDITRDTSTLHLLVWEQTCSGGSPATGRMSPVVVDFEAATLTLTLGVRPKGGTQTCPGPPGTPAILHLPQPVGDRTLLDGGKEPPAPPKNPFPPRG
jgi:hypothetical protein